MIIKDYIGHPTQRAIKKLCGAVIQDTFNVKCIYALYVVSTILFLMDDPYTWHIINNDGKF